MCKLHSSGSVMTVYFKMSSMSPNDSFFKYQLLQCLRDIGSTIALMTLIGKCLGFLYNRKVYHDSLPKAEPPISKGTVELTKRSSFISQTNPMNSIQSNMHSL